MISDDTSRSARLVERPGFFWLITLTISLVVTLTLWQTAKLTREDSLTRLFNRGQQQLDLHMTNLRGQLGKYEYLPELLAANRWLVDLLDDPADQERVDLLNRYLQTVNTISGASDTYLMDPSGLTIAASNWDSERPFVGRNFSYRPYFQEAMRGKLGRYFALGTTSNKRGFYFAYPVRKSDQIRGAVVIKLNLASIEQAWGKSDSEFIVTDPDGVVFLTTKKEWRFKLLRPIPLEAQQRIKKSLRYSGMEFTPLSTKPVEQLAVGAGLIKIDQPSAQTYMIEERQMPEAGWKVHILTRISPVQAEVAQAVFIVAILLAVAILFALLWNQRRKRIKENLRFQLETQKNLEANEARIEAILDHTQAGLLTMERDGTIEFINRKAEEMFGRPGDDLIGHHLREYFDPSGHAEIDKIIGDAETMVSVIEVVAKHGDGSMFPTALSVGVLHNYQGKKIATIHDISYQKMQEEDLRQAHALLETRVKERTKDLTEANARLIQEIDERQRAEEALMQARDELIQATKLAALGEMSTGISHELNQPLAAIRAYADNARALIDHGRNADALGNLTQISDLTERMAQISAQLKIFARKDSSQAVSVSLNAAVNHSLRILQPRIREDNTSIRLYPSAQEIFVLANSVQLEQVLVNLIGNALHAVEDNERRQIEISAEIRDQEAILKIWDNGPGIAEEQLALIFDPFFTTKEEGRGLGLGLSISHRLVEGMNGQLRAENHPDGGAVFTLQLPVAESGDEDEAVAKGEPERFSSN
ncbi:MAG: ATP-binding protein [Gammaproteobacteria bacterium]